MTPISPAGRTLPVSGSAIRTSTPGRGNPTVPATRSPIIRVGGVHAGLGHAVALEDGVPGAGLEVAVGLGKERRRSRNEQPHMGGGLAGQRRMGQEPRVEGRHAHEDRRPRHRGKDFAGIEFRQEDHRGAGKEHRVDGHEQAVGVIDRQGVDQHVACGDAPIVDEGEGVRGEIAVGQHRALGAAGGSRGVEDRRKVVRPAWDGGERGRLVRRAVGEAAGAPARRASRRLRRPGWRSRQIHQRRPGPRRLCAVRHRR